MRPPERKRKRKESMGDTEELRETRRARGAERPRKGQRIGERLRNEKAEQTDGASVET